MDVARAPQSKRGRNIGIGVGVLVLGLVTVALARMGPAAPTVEMASQLTDSVRRGDMVREVRGPGSLVPEHIRWITAQASARVDRIIAQSGQSVAGEAVLLELSNPDVQIQALQAEQQLSQAQATLTFKTGDAPSRIRPYISTVKGLSLPTNIKVVLKFSKESKKATAALPNSAGFKYGKVIVIKIAM